MIQADAETVIFMLRAIFWLNLVWFVAWLIMVQRKRR